MQAYHSKPVSYSDIYRTCQWQLLPNAWRYKRTRHWQLILYTLVCRKNDCNHFSDCNHFITSVFFLSLIYFSFPYSSSDTASHHSFEVSSPGTSTARCENQLSGAAPCQCFTSAGILMQSPGFISIASFPSS